MDSDTLDPRAILAHLTETDRGAVIAHETWLKSARPKQLLPAGDATTILWLAGRFFGKLLSLDTPIPTPTGWTTMGEIAVGDRVFDESGRACSVTHVSPVQFEPCYKVRFSDDSEITAGLSHQWVTWTHAERKAFLRSPYEEDTRRFPEEWPAWRLRKASHSMSPTVTEAVIEQAVAMRDEGWPLTAIYRHFNSTQMVMRRHILAGKRIDKKMVGVTADSPGPRIRTTGEILRTLRYGGRSDFNHCIPLALPLRLPDAALPIPPYTLGAWLGDGASADGSFYAHEDDMPFLRRHIEADGFETVARKDAQAFGTRGLYPQLRTHGLLKNKHIPAMYLRASIAQRLALLRGLMDTDGGVDCNGTAVSFTNTNKRLIDAVYELVVSLGMKANRDDRIPTCQNGPGERAYRLQFSPTMQVFTLPRKVETCLYEGTGTTLKRRHRTIVAVERTKDVALRCISVDGKHAMYLAGAGMVPTHNTRTLIEAAWWEAFRIPGLRIHALAPTIGDVRRTMFEGESGFLECMPEGLIESYNRSLHEITLTNGSKIIGFSATEEADRLRGPQCHMMIFDECAAADRPPGNLETAFKVAELGCRLPYPDGTPSRKLLATTPRPIPFLKNLMSRPKTLVVRGTSHENLANVAESMRDVVLNLEGTAFGRQEIYGEILNESEHAIFKRPWFRLWPNGKPLPEFAFILISIDPAVSEHDYNAKKQTSDPSGLGIFGVFNTRQCFTEQELKRLNVKSKYAALLCDYWTERLGFPDLIERIRKEARKTWGKTPGRRADLVLIENEKTGISIRQTLMQYGVATWPFNPHGQSKTMRAHAASPMLLQGMLFVPESGQADRKGSFRNWAEPLVDQMCAFAGEGSVEHDEAIDVVTQAMITLMERGTFHAEPQDRAYPDADEREEQERARAVRIAEQEKRGRYSPYGE